MLIIDGNNISLSRGNTAIIDVSITKDGSPYILKEGELIELNIKRKCGFNNVVLNKVSAIQSFIFSPSDTSTMGLGEYVYSITFNNGTTNDTFITGTFTLLCEVMSDD